MVEQQGCPVSLPGLIARSHCPVSLPGIMKRNHGMTAFRLMRERGDEAVP